MSLSLFNLLLVQVTGNRLAQRLSERIVATSQFFMGIGSGAGVNQSGEKAVIELLRRNYQAPYCIFDVGSNQGQYLNLLLRILSSNSCTVHCFEPSYWTFNRLKENSPDLSQVKLNNLALGKEIGEMNLYYDKQGSGLASLSKRRLNHFNIEFEQSETVKIDTLDHYCFKNSIDRIHLLKIDVEGHELDVLAGASAMFEKKAINMVAFEFGGCNIDTRSFFQDFYYFFQRKNMYILRITPSGYFYPINSYREIFEQFRTTNFVAINKG